jgi:hypothetical protein
MPETGDHSDIPIGTASRSARLEAGQAALTSDLVAALSCTL